LIAGDFKARRGRENRGKRDSECRMTTAANPLPYFLPFSTAFQKVSPYTENYNRKYLEILFIKCMIPSDVSLSA